MLGNGVQDCAGDCDLSSSAQRNFAQVLIATLMRRYPHKVLEQRAQRKKTVI
jgi:hypothetical protein